MTEASTTAAWIIRSCVVPVLEARHLRGLPELTGLLDAGAHEEAHAWLSCRRGALPWSRQPLLTAALNALLVATHNLDGVARDGRTFVAGCAEDAARAALAAGVDTADVVFVADGTPVVRAVELVALLGLRARGLVSPVGGHSAE